MLSEGEWIKIEFEPILTLSFPNCGLVPSRSLIPSTPPDNGIVSLSGLVTSGQGWKQGMGIIDLPDSLQPAKREVFVTLGTHRRSHLLPHAP